MRERLFIHFQSSELDKAHWAILDQHQNISSCGENLPIENFANKAQHRQVIVLLSSTMASIHSADIPTRKKSQLLKAIPYALEEKLAEEINQLHFAVGQQQKNQVTACVISKKRLSTLTQQLTNLGIQTDYIIPDILALEAYANSWRIIIDRDFAYIKMHQQFGMNVDIENVPILFQLLPQSDAYPGKIKIMVNDDQKNTLEKTLESLAEEIEIITRNTSITNIMAQEFQYKSAINLLQGEFTPRKHQLSGKSWLPIAVAASILVVIMLFMDILKYQHNKKMIQWTDQQIEKTFRSRFPETKKIINVKAQMKQKIKNLKHQQTQPEQILTLLNHLGIAIGNNTNINLKSVRFKKNTFSAQLSLKNLQTFDSIKQSLALNKQVNFELKNPKIQKNSVETQLIATLTK